LALNNCVAGSMQYTVKGSSVNTPDLREVISSQLSPLAHDVTLM